MTGERKHAAQMTTTSTTATHNFALLFFLCVWDATAVPSEGRPTVLSGESPGRRGGPADARPPVAVVCASNAAITFRRFSTTSDQIPVTRPRRLTGLHGKSARTLAVVAQRYDSSRIIFRAPM